MHDREVDAELHMDFEQETDRICRFIRQSLAGKLHRRGLVVGLSGGIDSSVCAALAVRAIGKDKVLGILMPETDSSEESLALAAELSNHLCIKHLVEDIAPALSGLGCYHRRDEAIREVLPEFNESWKCKITISGAQQGRINHFSVVAEDPEGVRHTEPLPITAYLKIVAATNFKQRIRKTMEYYHADARNYAVVGTPNLLEFDQGFFVKNGDGAADIKPISHLYKSQVYGMARHLGLPERICSSTPTTDTYSLAQGQDEFYFSLPYQEMDIALKLRNQDRPASDLAEKLDISDEAAQLVYDDIDQKRRTTEYLHLSAIRLNAV